MNRRIDIRWREIEPLLDGVLDQPASLRAAWLQAHCDDPELRTLVLSLLHSDSVHGAGIEARAAAAHDRLDARTVVLPEIPGYRVMHLIGEGGMASVFLAERTLGETVQRVALKRLRLNVYDRDERRRFEREHRILARLEHPNIARLLDAGIGGDGVPWFAMEYVDGEPLIAWCDARKLPADARLALFGEVCAAVQLAHQHLVVHRDLKPSNILVGKDGIVKLLDFGIARLLGPGTGSDDDTRTGHRRLTPVYAAPEQYGGQVSTATDIYALGVILIELVGGQRPAPGGEQDSDPLSGVAVTSAAARARSTTPRMLQRLLSGDLGAIARKALRSDPMLRYGSAQALGEDLAALRSGRPVAARRGDWRYRSACFVRRNKAGVATAVLVAITLATATGVSLTQARRANEQAERAQVVQAFVEDMLAPLRQGVPQARMPRLDEVLAEGVRRLDRTDLHDPAVHSELLVMLARTYDSMGEIDTARQLAVRAHRYSAAAFGNADVRTIKALAMRGRMHARFGDSGQARADLEAALAGMQGGDDSGATMAMVLDDLADLALQEQDNDRAAALYARAQVHRAKVLGPRHPDLAIGYANQALVQRNLGDPHSALALFERAHRHCAAFEGPETRQAAIYLGDTGFTKCQLGRWHEGAADYSRALAIFGRLDSKDHPERLKVLQHACWDWIQLDDLAQAQRHCDAAVAMAARLYGSDSKPHIYACRYRIALLTAQGRLGEAREEHGRILAVMRADPARFQQALKWTGFVLAETQRIEGDYGGLRGGLLEPVNAGGWEGEPSAAVLLATFALACSLAPDPACPVDLVARADAKLAEPLHRDHPWRIQAQLALAQLALARDDPAQARARLDDIQRVAALPHARLPAGHRWVAEARLRRGDALAAQGDRAQAAREWHAAEAVFAARYPAEHPFRRQLAARLSRVAMR